MMSSIAFGDAAFVITSTKVSVFCLITCDIYQSLGAVLSRMMSHVLIYGETNMINLDDCLKVGAIVTSHGVHGEAKIFPTTDDVNRFKKLKEVILDNGNEAVILHIVSVKFFKQFVILKFDEYTTPEEIMKIKGRDLYVTRENAVKLMTNEYFIADLIGMNVVLEDESMLGMISDVIVTGANDVYDVVYDGDKHVLIPAIKECILNVDVVNRSMKVHLLDGLMD